MRVVEGVLQRKCTAHVSGMLLGCPKTAAGALKLRRWPKTAAAISQDVGVITVVVERCTLSHAMGVPERHHTRRREKVSIASGRIRDRGGRTTGPLVVPTVRRRAFVGSSRCRETAQACFDSRGTFHACATSACPRKSLISKSIAHGRWSRLAKL